MITADKHGVRFTKNIREALIVFAILFSVILPASSQTWIEATNVPDYLNWTAIASSDDGGKLIAADYAGDVYTSTNSGANWTHLIKAPFVSRIASSADGMKLVAAAYPGLVYTSTNSGVSWVTNNAPNEPWLSVASSADGSTLVAVATSCSIYSSTNCGANWISNNTPSTGVEWFSVASSADGKTLAAAAYDDGYGNGGLIYTSTNSGAYWESNNVPKLNWTSIASSSDGEKLVAVPYPGSNIYTSTDSGLNWTPNSVPLEYWFSVASSADGRNLAAAIVDGGIYTSTNSGFSWISNSVPSENWQSIASSADGNKLVAMVDNYPNGGPIYTSYYAPTPQLNLTTSNNNLTLSWIVPSTNFVLQQNLNLTTTNWAMVTNAPALNLISLQYQVIMSRPSSNDFYRLATP